MPFRVDPRLDPKPWGSRRLERFGFPLPPGVAIGEALITAGEAGVGGGLGEAPCLAAGVAADPVGLVGRRGLAATEDRFLFPLLVKFIDAAENLSIQVHPDDEAARHLDRPGKTEAWYILAAVPDAVLYLGFRPDVSVAEFAVICRQGGETAGCLRRVPAIPGEAFLIPAGTVHALGAGVLVYEVQQPSDVTYRLDDWGRVDAAGRPRDLHLEAGLAVIEAGSRPGAIPQVAVGPGSGRRLLAACRYFALEQLSLAAGAEAPLALSAPESPQVVTCLEGEAVVAANDRSIPVGQGETVVIPARASGVRVVAVVPTVLLRAWVPELEAEIVRPARLAGANDDAIAALAGELPDLAGLVMNAAGIGG